ncbi:NAD(P)-dependent oxidoreductase [Starkeya sp. ORNL1]|uniref:NAD(P)-dependent oxidoreductase n=1 Tax=Starkeya sp. ORNL1 TaxID=2709380 RepID=UPI001462B736|nr:NAD(P)-dependent oxidoreductase [Starkeya sp. ORNL1]QJP13816.1 NAD(P)-dependent oxidoreductase [Starkeya sp. ORNL1]
MTVNVAIAGLGRMGSAIAERLLAQGHHVTVWNRSPERAAPLVALGAVAAPTPRALATAADVILTSLTDETAVGSVYAGGEGLLAGAVAGKLFIDLSTVRPHVEIELAAKVRGAGADFLECPVGGSVVPARNGQLLGFAGGRAEDLDRARPVLDALCRRVTHAGDVGAGSSLKLAVNLPLLVYWQALGEAVTLCRNVGLSPAELIDVLSETSGAPPALKGRAAGVAAALGGARVPATSFDVDSVRKDLRTMNEEAASLGVELPLAGQALGIFDEASAAGWGDQDVASLPAYWRSRTVG